MSKLERGQTVMCFQRPYTREDFEGMATLHRFVRKDYGMEGFEIWEVYFGTDGPYQRKIDSNGYDHWLKQCIANKVRGGSIVENQL